MARGRKRAITTDEEIKNLITEIEQKETELSQLKERLAVAHDTQKRERLDEIYEMMIASGKTFDDIKRMLTHEE